MEVEQHISGSATQYRLESYYTYPIFLSSRGVVLSQSYMVILLSTPAIRGGFALCNSTAVFGVVARRQWFPSGETAQNDEVHDAASKHLTRREQLEVEHVQPRVKCSSIINRESPHRNFWMQGRRNIASSDAPSVLADVCASSSGKIVVLAGGEKHHT